MTCEEYACATQVKYNEAKSFLKEHSHFLQDTIFPHIVFVLEKFPPSLLSKEIKYHDNYLNWLQFSNSLENTFRRNYIYEEIW